jgi:tRNA threonylcarbamoyladenosine biosynthesis protein TsaE
MIREVKNLSELAPVAAEIAMLLAKYPVCLFYGSMGAGKTTLITRICKSLIAEGNLSSPTFTIVNEYHTTNGNAVYHIDLYRLNSLKEVQDAGIEEFLNSGNICLVEWPEMIAGQIEGPRLEIHISLSHNNSRQIEVKQFS